MRCVFALCFGLVLTQGLSWADDVTRSVVPVAGGCQVTLSWNLSGKAASDLVIEERLAPGWSVDDATVPLDALDATWFSGSVARFAVKSSRLASPGSISFTVLPGDPSATGTIEGDWQVYLNSTLRTGTIAGQNALTAVDAVSSPRQGAEGSDGSDAEGTPRLQENAVAIKSFRVDGGGVELTYSGLLKAGTLVVEGCEGLGKSWSELKRKDVSAGDGRVQLSASEVGACRFMRMKLLTVED